MGQVYSAEWYKTHKDVLSTRRKKRYRENPEIRQKAIDRAAERRASARTVRPAGYDITFDDAAYQVGITKWALAEWRKKSYFPEPKKISGKLWFTPAQVKQVARIKAFFDKNGIRVGLKKKPLLDEVVNLVFANW